jgi:hypothetical protein
MLVSFPNHVQNVLSNEFEIDWTAHDPIGMTRFTLADEDIDLGLVPEPPRFDVPGRAILRSGAFAGAELDLAALPELIFMNEPYAVTSTPSTASVGPDGSFVVENLYPALFAMLFQVELLPANWYVAAATSRGRNVLTEGLRVEGAPAPIEVVLAGDAGWIEGRVLDSGGAAVPDARVILIPPAERRGPMLDFPTAVADHAGAFSLERIPPGDYRILAVNPSGYPERNPYWQSPTFLADYEGRGERISIEPSARIVMNPEAVPFAF